MLKKENIIKWTIKAKQSFREINHALTSSIFSKTNLDFSFFSEHTIVGVLLKKNSQDME